MILYHPMSGEGYLWASGLFTDDIWIENYHLATGKYTDWPAVYWIGDPICGVRIDLALLFGATGISLIALNFAAKKQRRILIVLTLVLGLASLIGSIILTTRGFQDSGLESLRYLTQHG
jgi:hypothetical protein